ncbi:MAG: hypothetical protein KF874_11960 [Rhizobiaceae bacterium]|nr:hypothetical protein [Rhizobiaceae bacterium]
MHGNDAPRQGSGSQRSNQITRQQAPTFQPVPLEYPDDDDANWHLGIRHNLVETRIQQNPVQAPLSPEEPDQFLRQVMTGFRDIPVLTSRHLKPEHMNEIPLDQTVMFSDSYIFESGPITVQKEPEQIEKVERVSQVEVFENNSLQVSILQEQFPVLSERSAFQQRSFRITPIRVEMDADAIRQFDAFFGVELAVSEYAGIPQVSEVIEGYDFTNPPQIQSVQNSVVIKKSEVVSYPGEEELPSNAMLSKPVTTVSSQTSSKTIRFISESYLKPPALSPNTLLQWQQQAPDNQSQYSQSQSSQLQYSQSQSSQLQYSQLQVSESQSSQSQQFSQAVTRPNPFDYMD